MVFDDKTFKLRLPIKARLIKEITHIDGRRIWVESELGLG
jgi:hypothetical protein